MVCRIIGLREVWYFGLQYTNKKGHSCWLQLDKKILKQGPVRQSNGSYFFLFLVKFYPEAVEDELVQDLTRHLFFVQIKQSILSMDLYCQPPAAVLLASYAVQAMYGDYSDDIELELDKLLPKSVIDQYEMTSEMWKEKIKNWWITISKLTIEEAEMEYLRVAQDLSMYGIQYYPIYNQKDTDLLLGISAQGLGIYEVANRISPRPFFPWSEIKNIHFNDKLFTIKVMDKSKIKFRAQEATVSHSILDLCIGTHNLYLRRRQADSLEVQQMKLQAQEARSKKQQELQKWQKEREQRLQAEVERDRIKNEMEMVNNKLMMLENMMRTTEETSKLIAEKAKISEEEAWELSKRASQAEAEVQRVKMSQIEAEETKIALQRKVRDAELLAHRLMQENQISNTGRPVNDDFLIPFWNYAAQNLSLQQDNGLNRPKNPPDSNPTPLGESAAEGDVQYIQENPITVNGHNTNNNRLLLPELSSSQYFTEEIENLKQQINQSNEEYFQRNRDFRGKLAEFRKEIESLKVEDRQTDNDKIYENNIQKGWDKYSTLRKVCDYDNPKQFLSSK